ncbi:MAG: hypothetical protein ABIS50_01045 [Luteolibacter sp.]|uniref:hypothetical protein n=1 Tax=Luteolibacter sp. TaxID=1962973 RepID=UPI0032666986
MSAILRASGTQFDVDAFLADSSFLAMNVYRKGEPSLPVSKPDGRKNARSGINVEVSGAGFDDIELQFKEVFFFMRDHANELSRLRDFDGVENLCIDFGADIYPPGYSCFRFPFALLGMAGKLKLDLELSVYPTDSEDESIGDDRRLELEELYEEYLADSAADVEQGVVVPSRPLPPSAKSTSFVRGSEGLS